MSNVYVVDTVEHRESTGSIRISFVTQIYLLKSEDSEPLGKRSASIEPEAGRIGTSPRNPQE